jgi:hypothetical protein
VGRDVDGSVAGVQSPRGVVVGVFVHLRGRVDFGGEAVAPVEQPLCRRLALFVAVVVQGRHRMHDPDEAFLHLGFVFDVP